MPAEGLATPLPPQGHEAPRPPGFFSRLGDIVTGRVFTICLAILALLVGLAMLPLFLGLLVVGPVVGHATWHAYRATVSEPAA